MVSVNRILGIVFGVLLLGVSASAAERLPPVHVVFDLDWTLMSSIPDDADLSVYARDPRFFTVEGKHYRLSNGVAEAINRLLDVNAKVGYEYVKISFFSGGARSRNVAALKAIVLDPRTGRTAFDVAEKVLSFEDLKDLFPELPAENRDVYFTDRYRKNLIEYFKELDRTVAIDDVEKFFSGDQSKSLLWIGETYKDYPTFADAVRAKTIDPRTQFLPPDFAAWAADQNRILIASLEIEYALESELRAARDPRSRKIEFRERVQSVRRRYSKDELLQRLKRVHPRLSFFGCSALFRSPPKPSR